MSSDVLSVIPTDPHWQPDAAATTLDALEHDWPCGFARFELEVWDPEQPWFTEAQLAALAAALGHPVRQIRAHL